MTIASKCAIALTSLSEKWRTTPCRKLKFLVGLAALLALILAPALYGGQDEPVLKWHTYAGSFGADFGAAIAVDPSGNIYLAGWSDETWGSPINPHSGDRDVYVAKLNSTGGLEWNTFMGLSDMGLSDVNEAKAIALDGSDNVYVVGTSAAQWSGEPFLSGGPGAFVAKLNSNGELQWHRFMTQYGNLWGLAAAVDANGYVYVGGWGTLLWETPPSELVGGSFVAKLDSSGVEMWHAFLLETGPFGVRALAVDVSGNTYPAGWSEATWGNPIDPYSGGQDGFVAKLNNTGGLEWNTFIGSSGEDCVASIDLDESGNVYLAGGVESSGNYAAKLDSSGVRQWQTFMEVAHIKDIFVDGGQKVYVTGVGATHPGFIVALNRDGVLQWKTDLEAILESIALDRSGNVYVAGQIDWSWGTPVNPWAGDWDAFIAKMSTQQTYVFSGFDRPVDNQPIVNNAKAGSTIPVKWQITDLYGTPISDPTSFESLTSKSISCGSFAYNPIEEVEEQQSPGSSGLMYLGDGYWQFNWKTAKSYAGQCRIMVLNLADGSEHTAYFKFK